MIGLLSTLVIGGVLIKDAADKIRIESDNKAKAKAEGRLYYLDQKGRKRATVNGMPVTLTTNTSGDDVLIWSNTGQTYRNLTEDAVREYNKQLESKGETWFYRKCRIDAYSYKTLYFPTDRETGLPFYDECFPYTKQIKRWYFWFDDKNRFKYVYHHSEMRPERNENGKMVVLKPTNNLPFKKYYHI